MNVNVRQVVPKDSIPSIDEPSFSPGYFGSTDDRVVVVDASPPRAYPLRILNYHEIVNDVVDGRPIAVTWCPLCGSAVVYDRRVDGQTLTFGVSGKLADDDLVMYDRETNSLWKQSRGTAIDGELDGETLPVLPASILTYEAFERAHPDGVVLDRTDAKSEAASDTDEPAAIDYGTDPYAEYAKRTGFGLGAHRGTGSREWDRDDIDPKTVVVGIEPRALPEGDTDGGEPTKASKRSEPIGVPLSAVEAAGGVLTVAIDGKSDDVTIVAGDDGIFTFADPGFELQLVEGTLRGDGTTWNPVTAQSDDGRTLTRVPIKRLFAFAWQDDHGTDTFWIG